MKTRIFEQAKVHGFDAVRVTVPNLSAKTAEELSGFLAGGHHGDMNWMEERESLRRDPQALWPEAKSVIMLGHNYGPDENPLRKLEHKQNGVISAYAQHRDYHNVMKKRMKKLARWIAEEFSCDARVYVDTAPLLEKPLAAQSGLGWQGKHTCIISREFGNWLFLGEIFTSLELEPDEPERDHCGSCSKCLDICPTDAFIGAHKLDATRCIAYLTIEHKGQIPLEFRKAMGNRVYGCDDCLAVCPWNKFAQTSTEAAYHAREELKAPKLNYLLQLDNSNFRELFSGSPVKRTGRDRFIRNVLVAAGNSEDNTLLPQVEKLCDDNSPLVAEMAHWAKQELQKQTN